MSEHETENNSETVLAQEPLLDVQSARTCAACFVITRFEMCPKCGEATTRLFVPQEVLLDQLVRYVVKHVASLGAKIESLTDEIRVQNRLEGDKKRFSQLKNKVIAEISKATKDEEENDGRTSR